MKRLYGVLLIALAMPASLACFFAYKSYQASKLDNVHLLAPDQTRMATSTDGSLARSAYEISAFAARFLGKAFAHPAPSPAQRTRSAPLLPASSKKLLPTMSAIGRKT